MRPLILLALSACLPPSPGSSSGPSGTADPCTHATIDPTAGGSLSFDDVTIQFPSGSVSAATDVSACPASAPTGFTADSTVVDVEPADLALLVPAVAAVPHDGIVGSVVWSLDSAGAYAPAWRATDDGAVISATIYHLGTVFAALDPRTRDDATATDKADLLFMVDNSCSMADDQVRLGDDSTLAFDALAQSGLDYRIGVTSSDLDTSYPGSEGTLHGADGFDFVDSSTPDPQTVFSDMVAMGTGGSGNEKGTGAIYDALSKKKQNPDFRRDDAALGIVVLSDEPDSTPNNVIPLDEFIGWLDDFTTEPTFFYSVIDQQFGRDYQHVTDLIGGEVLDFHAPSYSQTLADLVYDLQQTLVELQATPDPATIEVWVLPADGTEPQLLDPAAWTLLAPEGPVQLALGATAAGDQIVVVYDPS